MEEYLIIVLTMMIGIFSIIIVKMFKPNQGKTKPKTKKEDAVQVLDDVQKETIDRLAVQLKKESGRANRLQALRNQETEVEEEPQQEIESPGSGKPATWEEIQALCKASYPQYYKYLALPGIQEKVMEQFKGLTLAQIIQQIQSLTGSGQSQPGTTQTDETYNPNFA